MSRNQSKPLGAERVTGHGRPRTAHEYVLSSLRASILEGELTGGTRLIQSDIANQLEVSVTPVREALRDLVAEGLVVFDPHRGALVRSLNMEEVRELYELRVALEPLMVRRTIERLTDQEITRAHDLQVQISTTKDIASWVELNRKFHAVFAMPDEASRLSTILASLRDSASSYVAMSLVVSPQRVAQSNEEHSQLVALYRKRDVSGAIALTLQHLQTTLETIEEANNDGLSSTA
ncbi:GntR family transcriptional regulator [Cryobacterium sp. Y50]|uniref:GntR family transcriptional regulator n=1 Tax=Cryobacterium sp. Y50 TaxID=2048286 RepID=UPI0013049FE2|nr:GntR family transcriptional regulator [Cryobacterium sp. Y50]